MRWSASGVPQSSGNAGLSMVVVPDPPEPDSGMPLLAPTSSHPAARTPPQHLAIEASHLIGLRVSRGRNNNSHGEDAGRVEPRVDSLQPHEALDEQPGAHEQEQRQRDLRRHQTRRSRRRPRPAVDVWLPSFNTSCVALRALWNAGKRPNRIPVASATTIVKVSAVKSICVSPSLGND